jgi:hypothetical protein
MRLGTAGDDQIPHLFVRGGFMAIEDSSSGGEAGAVADS